MHLATIASALMICAAGMGAAAAYPERPLRLIVASTPGGGPDVASRLIARQA
jgi:tripartite-type tricarboxylate transporter receptor subunit TctC